MLPLPNLDDKTFQQLLDDALKLIPQLAPAWTDHNLHDPGITFLELLVWLTEMQRYYLNQISDKSYRKFLKLLGVTPLKARSARTIAAFALPEGIPAVKVPRGTVLSAEGIVFETEKSLTVRGMRLDQIITATLSGYVHQSKNKEREGVSYFAFGERAEAGSRLYLGFNKPLEIGEIMGLTIYLQEDYPVVIGEVKDMDDEDRSFSMSKTYWEYGQTTDKESDSGEAWGAWKKLVLDEDGTRDFTQSGQIIFQVPADMACCPLNLANDYVSHYWLRCTVREDFELAPKLCHIGLNGVPVVQRQTLSEFISFTSNGEAQMDLEASHLALSGMYLLQRSSGDGRWQDLAKDSYRVIMNEISGELAIYYQEALPSGVNLRLISWLPGFAENRFLGRSDGLPGQHFSLPAGDVLTETMVLQVGEEWEDGLWWRDWQQMEDLDASAPGHHHYVILDESAEICFGDGINGAIPPAVQDRKMKNIRMIACSLGGGSKGNVRSKAIAIFLEPTGQVGLLGAENPMPAKGGRDKENLQQAINRFRTELNAVTRGVSAADYEALALATPGLRVARAKAYTSFQPAWSSSFTKFPQVNVVVVPYSNKSKPVPGSSFLAAVNRHLQAHRLIGTEVCVLAPEYVEVSVAARVVFRAGYQADQQKIIEELKAYFSPLGKEKDLEEGWTFGRAVFRSEIYALLDRVEGVDYVEQITLSTSGSTASLDEHGNVIIPPHGLVFPGEHWIEAVPYQQR